MFWLVSWVFLLLITPISWTEFINSGLAAHNVPYIGSNIFLAALAFFVAQFAKYLWYRAHSFCAETKQKNNLKKAIEKLHKLTEEEKNIVIYIFQNGSTEYMDEVPVSSICSLVNNKIIYSYDSNPTNPIYALSFD